MRLLYCTSPLPYPDCGRMSEREAKALSNAVVRRMDARIATWTHRGDGRAVFLQCYRIMTGNMLGALRRDASRGGFHDPVWVKGLLQRFADSYFRALRQYESGSPATPRIWQQAHDVSLSGEAPAATRLLLGINAHINYDLVLTLYEWLRPEWDGCSAAVRTSRYADHCQVNTIISASIDAVQDDVLSPQMPLTGILDTLLGPVDEMLISELVAAWRETVWQSACELLDAATPDERAAVIAQVEERSLRIAEHIH